MSFTANDVKTLREKTNVGMMDCKKALEEAKGDMELAVEVLRKRGLSVAQKKAGRTASEGILGTYSDDNGKLACMVEINCETDFVVRTDDFQNFVSKITKIVKEQGPKDMEGLLKLSFNEKETVQDALTLLIAKIGENIQLKRFVRWEAGSNEKVGCYVHAGSKIGVLTVLQDASGKVTSDSAKEVSMHIAAMNPRYIRRDEVPATVVEKEKEIQRATVDTKKPAEIQNKIIEGKLNRFFSEVCLEEQAFVKDPEGKKTVGGWLKEISPTAKIEKFVRLQVGA
ncbi:MAG: translation elongation factor Ts [Deltaproteobacteria bacterium]|nr:translation elongation factor Ts [Deltaproteobacteria bacterium]